MSDVFLDQAIEGVLETGVTVELARWASDADEYDADGWLDQFGERVGSGTAKISGNVWANLSNFCILRPVVHQS